MRYRACTLEELKSKGRLLFSVKNRSVALFYHEGKVYALDNRCPHMGFPLIKGSLSQGILTCDWHHARFDLESGCTLDLWADDAITHKVEVINGDVWITIDDKPPSPDEHLNTLNKGLDHGIRLIIAKALTQMIYSNYDTRSIYEAAYRWYSSRSIAWGGGATFITAVNNITPYLSRRDLLMGLLRGLSLISQEARERPPRRIIDPIKGPRIPLERLNSWLRMLVEVRDETAIERLLVSLVEWGYSLNEIASLLFSTATDHYLSDGHVVDFSNKAFEAMEYLGRADKGILRSLAPLLARATRYEEEQEWRHPIDLVDVINRQYPALFDAFKSTGEPVEAGLVASIVLQDNPHQIASGITSLVEKGYNPRSISLGVALAAAKRIAAFSPSNDIGDWISVVHSFTYSNAIHQVLRRVNNSLVFRGVYHAALRIYLDRFLNMPPYRIPKGSSGESQERILRSLLDAMNKRYMINEVAEIIADYLANNYDIGKLVEALCHAVLREDADFHNVQVLEAGIRLLGELNNPDDVKTVLVAVGRYTASQTPTRRTLMQVANIAERLFRGEDLHVESPIDTVA